MWVLYNFGLFCEIGKFLNKQYNDLKVVCFLQHFQEMDNDAKRFTLPLFGPLGRASSAHQVGQNHRPSLSSSFSNPASTQDLSISPPVSPSKPALMPQLSRRQRRASLVSHPLLIPSLPPSLPQPLTYSLTYLQSLTFIHTYLSSVSCTV